MMNKETLTDEQYLREVSEKWNQCPICGSESSFEIKKKELVGVGFLVYTRLICKNCSAEWYADRPFFFAGKIKGLILRKPDLEGRTKKYIEKIHSPEWWVEMNLAEHVKKREVVVKRWSEIAEKNPGLTQEELKEIYIKHYPEDTAIKIYLEEKEKKEIERKETEAQKSTHVLQGIHDILLIFLMIGIILFIGTCIMQL